jgi:hypothetical protein
LEEQNSYTIFPDIQIFYLLKFSKRRPIYYFSFRLEQQAKKLSTNGSATVDTNDLAGNEGSGWQTQK